MATEQQQARQPIDTEAMKKLIAKIKKGDAENAAEIETVKRKGLEEDNGVLYFR